MSKRKIEDMMDVDSRENDHIDQRETKKMKKNMRTIACQTDTRVYTEAEVQRMLQHCNDQFDRLMSTDIKTTRWVR
tara:strand:- start:482 stop:709 length:228 start_codon:yes stop_codon:yes gene_type:complete